MEPTIIPIGRKSIDWSWPPKKPLGENRSCDVQFMSGSGWKPMKPSCSIPCEMRSAFTTPREVTSCVPTCACEPLSPSIAMPEVITPSRSAVDSEKTDCAAEQPPNSSPMTGMLYRNVDVRKVDEQLKAYIGNWRELLLGEITSMI